MLNNKQQEFVKHALEKFGKSELTVVELKQANKKFGCKYAPQWLIKNKDYKVGKSLFKLPVDGEAKSVISKVKEQRLFPLLQLQDRFAIQFGHL